MPGSAEAILLPGWWWNHLGEKSRATETREAEETCHVWSLSQVWIFYCKMIYFAIVWGKGSPGFLLIMAGSILANVSSPFGYSHFRLLRWPGALFLGQFSMEANKLKSPYLGSSSKIQSYLLTFHVILYKIRDLTGALWKVPEFKMGLPSWKWHHSHKNNFNWKHLELRLQ